MACPMCRVFPFSSIDDPWPGYMGWFVFLVRIQPELRMSCGCSRDQRCRRSQVHTLLQLLHNSVPAILFTIGGCSFQCVVPPFIDTNAPTKNRGLWLSIFYLASPVGQALGYIPPQSLCDWQVYHTHFPAGLLGVE